MLELSLPHFLVVILLPLAPFLFYFGSVNRKLKAVKLICDCTSGILECSNLSSSFVTVLQASQVTLVFYQPSSSTAAVLLNFSGCGCLLPTQVRLQLYFLTSQAEVVFYQLKFNVFIKIYSSSTVSSWFY
jgi:hypothetical protein